MDQPLPVPVRLFVELVVELDGVDRDEACRRLALPLQQLGYAPDARAVTVPDAVALIGSLYDRRGTPQKSQPRERPDLHLIAELNRLTTPVVTPRVPQPRRRTVQPKQTTRPTGAVPGEALEALQRCFPELSTREAEILYLVAAGLGNVEIGKRLYVTVNTVKTYARTGFAKIGVRSRSQATGVVIAQAGVTPAEVLPPTPTPGRANGASPTR